MQWERYRTIQAALYQRGLQGPTVGICFIRKDIVTVCGGVLQQLPSVYINRYTHRFSYSESSSEASSIIKSQLVAATIAFTEPADPAPQSTRYTPIPSTTYVPPQTENWVFEEIKATPALQKLPQELLDILTGYGKGSRKKGKGNSLRGVVDRLSLKAQESSGKSENVCIVRSSYE